MYSPPQSILIIGSGVFGLSTAEALARRPEFRSSTITVVDRGSPDVVGSAAGSEDDYRHFPARDSASIDTSRIIRYDYADPAYAALAAEAQQIWRGIARGQLFSNQQGTLNEHHIGADGRYTESGLMVVADAAEAEAEVGDNGSPIKTGLQYVRDSWANVNALADKDAYMQERLRLLPDAAAIRAAMGTGGSTGSFGYLNGACGWANAQDTMAWMLSRTRQYHAITFVRGQVVALETKEAAGQHDNDVIVTGIRLADGRTLHADLVIAAAGAWTESLVDGTTSVSPSSSASLAGCLVATGQVVGFVPITDAERAQLLRLPVILNLSTGLFIIPPAPDSRELKVARHGYGYVHPLASSASISTPHTTQDDPSLEVPAEGAADLRRGLRAMVPLSSGLADRPFSRTRICWYTDTPTGDFLIDYHPRYRSTLFLATGGSGHGFKFLPVLGDRIVDCLVGQRPAAFADKWAWKNRQPADGSPAWQHVVTKDGSRGGPLGLVLRDELAKSVKGRL